MLKEVNFFEVSTPTGNKTVELLFGDISLVDRNVDIIVASAFAGSYYPSPGSLFGALYSNVGFLLNEAHIVRDFDYRSRLGVFLIPVHSEFIKDLVVVEMRNSGYSLDECFENLFLFLSALELKKYHLSSIMMPILGTGLQAIPPDVVLEKLIHKSNAYLKQSIQVQKISFVAFEPSHVDLLNNTINKVIGRPRPLFPTSTAIKTIRMQALVSLEQIASILPLSFYEDIKAVLKMEVPEPFRFAILCRRLAEVIVNMIVPNAEFNTLNKNIGMLNNFNIAPWVINYLHLLRVFGNEFAHIRTQPEPIPSKILENDFLMVLIALENTLRFMKEYRQVNLG